MLKVFSISLFAGAAILLVLGGVLRFTIHSFDLQILDVYFVVLPRYLWLLSAALALAALAVRRCLALR